jgi:peptidoglycan hydrolase-like protein with peptidoglycan-binding domain
MANTVDKVLKIAEAEVGYLEKKSNKDLNSKQGNSGYNNYTKYWADLKPEWQGQPWCLCWIVWIFLKAFGEIEAKKLLCVDKDWTYYTPTAANYFKKKGQWKTKDPKVGDVIFFKNSVRICHVGIVAKVDDTYIYTIEGNTSSAAGVESNGGAVYGLKKYKKSYSKIAGFGDVKYDTLKSIEEISKDVINGKYGNGNETRKEKLEAEGYNYEEVKAMVNKLLKVETTSNKTTASSSSANKTTAKKKDTYTQKEFIQDCQSVFKVDADGIAGKVTMSKVITISTIINRKHKVVKYIQKYLKELGYKIEVDGVYGFQSKSIVKKFQEKKGLKPDGIIGKNTWKALFGVK